MDSLPAKQIQNQRGEKGGARREDRAAERLIDGLVDHRPCYELALAAEFPQAIEDHDRVVDRETDDRQQCRHHVEADLEIIDECPAHDGCHKLAQRQAGNRHEHVVREGHHGREAEGHILKPQPDVEHDHQQAGEQRVDCRHLRVAGDLATDRVRREIHRCFVQLLRDPLQHTAGDIGLQRRRQSPVTIGPRSTGHSLGLEFEGSVTNAFRFHGLLDRGPEREQVDLFREVERRDRAERLHRLLGVLARVAILFLVLLRGRRDLAEPHRVGGQTPRKRVLQGRFHRIVVPQRRVDLVPQVGNAVRGRHTADGHVGEPRDLLPNLGNIEPLIRFERHLHARATGEVDVEQPGTALHGGRQSDQHEQRRADDRRPHPRNELEVRLPKEPAHLQGGDPAIPLGQIEQHPRAENRGEEVERQAEDKRDRETLQLIGSNSKQHHAGNQRREIGIDDRGEGPLKAVPDRHSEAGAAVGLLPHPLVDEHIGIDGHAHREHEAGEPRKSEGGLDRDHQRHDENDIEQHRQIGNEP